MSLPYWLEETCKLILGASVIISLCRFIYISPDTLAKIHKRVRFIISSRFLYKDIFITLVFSYIRNHPLPCTLYSAAPTL